RALLAAVPCRLQRRFAHVYGPARWLGSPGRREASGRLERCLGGTRGKAELRRLALRHFQFLGRDALLKRGWAHVSDLTTSAACRLDGLDHLDEALARGNGAILLSAHFGYGRLIKPFLRLRG